MLPNGKAARDGTDISSELRLTPIHGTGLSRFTRIVPRHGEG
jgi:hypothetical protein